MSLNISNTDVTEILFQSGIFLKSNYIIILSFQREALKNEYVYVNKIIASFLRKGKFKTCLWACVFRLQTYGTEQIFTMAKFNWKDSVTRFLFSGFFSHKNYPSWPLITPVIFLDFGLNISTIFTIFENSPRYIPCFFRCCRCKIQQRVKSCRRIFKRGVKFLCFTY